nr:twin-arginine translocation signal domain-containing protein [Saprospiraceae bacterium]
MSVVNNRRDFLKISGLASAGLILGIPGLNAAQTIVKL